MKNISFSLLLVCLVTKMFAQKPAIDSTAIANWQHIGMNTAISNDGDYFLFSIYNSQQYYTLVVQKTDNSWKKEFPGVSTGNFSGDNKNLIFKRNDTLFSFSLKNEQLTYTNSVRSYVLPDTDDGKWLAYQLDNPSKDLILKNLFTGKEQRFVAAESYRFNSSGKILLLKTVALQDTRSMETLQRIDMEKEKVDTIWSESGSDNDEKITNFCLNSEGTQLAFIVKKKSQIDVQTSTKIWYYNTGMDKADIAVNDQAAGIPPDLSISNAMLIFSADSRYIFFNLQQLQVRNTKPNPDAVMVDIWSYKDSILQSTQLVTGAAMKKQFLAVVDPKNKQVVQLEQEDEQLKTPYNQVKGDFVVIMNKKSINEYWWKTFQQKTAYIVSLKNGTRRFLHVDSLLFMDSISPNGKYIVYYDPDKKNYFSYILSSGTLLNISAGIPEVLHTWDWSDSLRNQRNMNVGIAGWLENDTALLIYDNYDIWKLDPSGKKLPVNITNGYGKLHNIKLRFMNGNPTAVYSSKDKILLTAYNSVNKDNGFYIITLSKKRDPVLLSMGPYFSYILPSQAQGFLNVPPVKAKKARSWLLMRQSENDAPNFFLTSDFKVFKKLTDIQPQKSYNWLTTELVTWKQLDGTTNEGVLYKPENFDSTRKYPVIFMYYDKMSDYLHEFQDPDFTSSSINIPWFVSREYLVFRPDIHYYIGKIGESVCNSVISAALHLSRQPWADATRMGINGHSFGGYETNYLVTHSHIFTAAATAAGVSNFVSHYGDVSEMNDMSSEYRFEGAQYRIGFSLWERPDLYLNNSPILKADKVTTPLLIMHNKADNAVPWSQSVEFFTGLRRLGKKVWMLQYDQGNHGVSGKDAIDYTIRLTQFFDYYLKGSLPPKWMTEGIPAAFKGIETGYELDTSGKQP